MRSFVLALLALAGLGVEAGYTGEMVPRQDLVGRDVNQTLAAVQGHVTFQGIDYLFCISAPAYAFTTKAGIQGGSQTPGTQGPLGMNIILDDDGAPHFKRFPLPGMQPDLINVMLAPTTPDSMWGQHAGGPRPSDLTMVDGIFDAEAVYSVTTELLQWVASNHSTFYFTGIGGGSLLLSGYFTSTQMPRFGDTARGMLLMCGAMQSPDYIGDVEKWIGTTRIHYQSTQRETLSLQKPLIEGILSWESIITGGVYTLNESQVAQLQTVDNTPDGGHCEFDGQSAATGVELILRYYGNLMYPNRNGSVPGINKPSLLTGVWGNENLAFH